MDYGEILEWLRQSDENRLEALWQRADDMRKRCVGDEVHLRGLLEISNHCCRNCHYCGLRVSNSTVERYRMTAEEILAAAQEAANYGYGTVVIQAGEDYGLRGEDIAELVARIKEQTPLAVTLSLGERSDEELALWRRVGADRYLLRFETSNRQLYDAIHPGRSGVHSDRFALLGRLRELGYEVGSGVMIGIPGQKYDDLANDIEMFGKLDLDMVGVGPFIAHPETPLWGDDNKADDCVENTELMAYKVIALTRLMCPLSNIPSTTALATLNIAAGRELGLARGANVVMPNVTPMKYRAMYEIYPAKACINEEPQQCHDCIKDRIKSIGRKVGVGEGESPNMKKRK